MRKLLTAFLLIAFSSLIITQRTQAQSFEHAGQYMDYIGKANEKITVMYLTYLSAVGHNKSLRKVEKRREELINNIMNTRLDIMGMPAWKGDRSYKDTTAAYLQLLYHVFNEDFRKIMNMEEIAEQSYDAMEAYMMAQELAQKKLGEANEKLNRTQKDFAKRHEVKIIDGESELERKSKEASALMKHYSDVYLIFFKAFHQEGYVMDALAKNNLTALEQSKNALLKYANEGQAKLRTMNGYNNDPTLIAVCRDILTFFETEANKLSYATDFLMKQDAFAKMKKSFESKPAAQRTKKDVDEFNKGVNDINFAVNTYNSTNNQLNNERNRVLNNWNNAVKKYLDTYMPVQKR